MDKAKQFKMVWYRLDREVEIQNVADHLKKIYENLWSQQTLEEDFDKVHQERVHNGLQGDALFISVFSDSKITLPQVYEIKGNFLFLN